MKLAIPVSSGRVSTAFDFARHLLLLEYEVGRSVAPSWCLRRRFQ
jgi:hypothetical protein